MTSTFKTYVNNNLLSNCDITGYGINRYEHINEETTLIIQDLMRRKKPTVHSKIEKLLYLFQYKRDTKPYIYTWTFVT